jgi:hypothetical protein
MTKVAVLDDWQDVAQSSTDWSPLIARTEVVFFKQAFIGEEDAVEKLADFEIILSMRDREPLPVNHPLRSTPNTVMTPHLGYGVHETWTAFYRQSLENALAFLDGKPLRVMNPEALRAV